MTAPRNDRPASARNAPRQPMRSPSDAGNEAAGESAEARARDIDAGDARHLGRRPLVADIGDGDGEDRRQQQALDEAPEDERPRTSPASATPAIGTTTASIAAVMTRLRPSTSAMAPVNGAVKAIASALAVMMVLISAGADTELARQRRQQRLRRIEVEEGAEAGGRATAGVRHRSRGWGALWRGACTGVTTTRDARGAGTTGERLRPACRRRRRASSSSAPRS